ncbi:acyltransferase family protein [Aeromonas veronii]|uniref:acyltransferase family protein n=1 Tax=Aeromonas veronii TaxID=654 RepID=UPI002B48486A|nr:acyltransferase [Aeromonas veronii]
MSLNQKRIYGIDGLRFIAAISVVLFHYLSYSVDKTFLEVFKKSDFGWLISISNYGFLGVELFFMISGFVILYSAKGKSWQGFARSRFLRIYPMLWLTASITFVCLVFLGATNKEPSLWQYLTNLTLMHRFIFNQPHLDGVYWTLTVELRFYLIIGILIAYNLLTEKNIKLIMFLWAVTGLIYLSLGKNGNFITSGTYFAAGVGFYYIWSGGRTIYNIGYMLLTFIISSISVVLSHASEGLSHGVLVILMCSFFCIFYLLVNGWTPPISKKIMTWLGGLTYPLYLLHQEIGYSLLQYINNGTGYIYYALFLVLLMSLLSWGIYYLVEPRLNKYIDFTLGLLVRKFRASSLTMKC